MAGIITETATRYFGSEDALDDVDSILVMAVAEYASKFPALSKAQRMALTAIVEVSRAGQPQVARDLMLELNAA